MAAKYLAYIYERGFMNMNFGNLVLNIKEKQVLKFWHNTILPQLNQDIYDQKLTLTKF